ncbi:hypothetical protein EC99P1_00012 [Enterococcus phage EC99P1]|nr:hypothetical protein EC99P1_00012 [Enterococcus phage EC99P1]
MPEVKEGYYSGWIWIWTNPNEATYQKYGLFGSFLGDAPRIAVGDVYTSFRQYNPMNFFVTAIDNERKVVKMELNQR